MSQLTVASLSVAALGPDCFADGLADNEEHMMAGTPEHSDRTDDYTITALIGSGGMGC